MSYELIMLGMSALIAIGILLHHPSQTFGIPSLLIFMGVGLLVGNGEFNFVYDDLDKTSWVGTLALNVIVFSGGLNTSFDKIKRSYKEGGVLATFGVLLTTLIFALILYVLTHFDFTICLLFAAIVSSTDAAAVFSILESKKLRLKEQTDSVLEFESATNDPIALSMVLLLTGLAMSSDHHISASNVAIELTTQIVVASVVSILLGKLVVSALNHIKLAESGLIPVFVLSCFILASYGSEHIGGNILLASYLFGVIVGNGLQHGKEVNKHFFNGLSWLAQALMFIVLGLQIFPGELMSTFWYSLLPAVLLICVARPIAVQLCYLPFTQASWQKRLFISLIGLKGATPIVFALIPAAAGVPGADKIVHMVFFIVVISVMIQGGIIAPLAYRLGLKQTPES
ncbi:potassium/proton antiporter (CPA1 family) [Sinobacterium caligoides]|uniref:Potassium/proton antiporter (CPA1 family) n=1 Tax=Sinobacterium caligoides TaxID=933926 RepID=A0A3N2DYG4_9GAMM|nr:potassium/proton antiporter [Sinobacterium caligoides]ROS04824.1 potassium/proton antiporter (CPA1 family) [Sinobacterium caligoides]